MPAEFGRTGGAVVNAVYKSGTNSLHGTLYDFAKNRALNANTWLSNRSGQAKTFSNVQIFGGRWAVRWRSPKCTTAAIVRSSSSNLKDIASFAGSGFDLGADGVCSAAAIFLDEDCQRKPDRDLRSDHYGACRRFSPASTRGNPLPET